MSTQDQSYTQRLVSLSASPLRRIFNVQAPYAWNIRRTVKGLSLDIGCGIGRNLSHLRGEGVGVDHNKSSVDVCRQNGLLAFTPDEFTHSEHAKKTYQTILLSHVIEHLTFDQAGELLRSYLPLLARDGLVVIICPQKRGFSSDSTHVTCFDTQNITDLVKNCGLQVCNSRSFPLPRWCGRLFTHNETIVIAERV
jgi:2-polyprenyl-3-methyl-5-hydroxy-6-metoxy-1,4-benzoquinol methylase